MTILHTVLCMYRKLTYSGEQCTNRKHNNW